MFAKVETCPKCGYCPTCNGDKEQEQFKGLADQGFEFHLGTLNKNTKPSFSFFEHMNILYNSLPPRVLLTNITDPDL